MFAPQTSGLALQGSRTTGSDVRSQNVTAVTAVANIVKSSLGPVGLDKVRSGGERERRKSEGKAATTTTTGGDLMPSSFQSKRIPQKTDARRRHRRRHHHQRRRHDPQTARGGAPGCKGKQQWRRGSGRTGFLSRFFVLLRARGDEEARLVFFSFPFSNLSLKLSLFAEPKTIQTKPTP